MATDQLIARDIVIRQAAFDHIRGLQSRDLILSHEDIGRGFIFQGQRWPLWNPQRGIFKPRGMPFLLSIRTVFPRKGGRIWYDDQRQVHQQIFAGDEELDYAFMGKDPSAADNVWLREAAERQIPFIYFLGVSPGRYQAIVPCYRHGDRTGRGRAPVRPPADQAAAAPGILPGQRAYRLRSPVR
jgi:putative restriction endonuclease